MKVLEIGSFFEDLLCLERLAFSPVSSCSGKAQRWAWVGGPWVKLVHYKFSNVWIPGLLGFFPLCFPKAKMNERQGLFEQRHDISGLVGCVEYNQPVLLTQPSPHHSLIIYIVRWAGLWEK